MSWLRECPFCGFDTPMQSPPRGDLVCRVTCPQCDADGPEAMTAGEAADSWNRRTDDRWELTEAGRAMRGGK